MKTLNLFQPTTQFMFPKNNFNFWIIAVALIVIAISIYSAI
jgi:hypothetical protein